MIADDPWWTSLGWSETEYRRFCNTKRFLERWRADRWFRSAVRRSPQRTFDEYGLAADPESVRAIWDAADADRLSSPGAVEAALTEAVREYRDYSQWRAVEREKARARAAPQDTRWRGFYRRQVARARTELGPAWCAEVPFLPAAFELSEGCSVGCWFCALSASRAGRQRAHDLEGRRAFRSLLEAVGELAGTPSLAQSPLYWATDPFDNPDFEEFAEDFRERAGALPRVTTALALRDLGRTRAWLSRSAAQRPTAIRFSVLHLSQLGMLHAAFTPEQLGHVELLPMNRESLVPKASAGRFRQAAERDARLLQLEADKLQDPTNVSGAGAMSRVSPTAACVCGFLFNLVEQSVRLVTPCRATDRWPLGYEVLARERFRDVSEIKDLLRELVAVHMSDGLPGDVRIAFRDDIRYRQAADGFDAWARHGGFHFGHPQRAAFYAALGAAIADSCHTPGSIAAMMWERCRTSPAETLGALNAIHDAGLLMETRD